MLIAPFDSDCIPDETVEKLKPWLLTMANRLPVIREAGILLVFCALTALLTWPYVTRMRDAVVDPGDPYLISWILWWDYHQTFAHPLQLFPPLNGPCRRHVLWICDQWLRRLSPGANAYRFIRNCLDSRNCFWLRPVSISLHVSPAVPILNVDAACIRGSGPVRT